MYNNRTMGLKPLKHVIGQINLVKGNDDKLARHRTHDQRWNSKISHFSINICMCLCVALLYVDIQLTVTYPPSQLRRSYFDAQAIASSPG